MVKNKPKRLKRNKRWRVARRKKKRDLLINGKSRNRKVRPKKGVADVVEVKKVLKKITKSSNNDSKESKVVVDKGE